MLLPVVFLLLISSKALLAQSPAPASDRPAPPHRLTCNHAQRLLVAELTGAAIDTSIFVFRSRRDADAALLRLTDLAVRSPRCPAAHGARGLVKRRLTRTDWIPKDMPGQRAGVRWKEDAVYDLGLAAKSGGRTGVAAAAIGIQLLLPGQVEMPYLVREVGPDLLAVPPVPSEVPDTISNFLRGRLAAWLWRPSIADSAFSAYRAAGGSPHRASLELARLRLASAGPGADSLYYHAAVSDDSAVVRELRADLALIADSAELRSFDQVPATRRAQWLRRFWEDRDLEALKSRGTRLRDHYARIAVARQRFRLLSYPRQYELNELWINRDAEYDDRGLVYIRHGPPDATASAVRAGTCPNTSWLYRRPEGNWVFHFVARQNPDDWRLVETLANVAGESGATTRVRQAGSARSCGSIEGLLESRSTLDPIYGELAANQTRRNWERELEITTHSREIGTTTDSDLHRYPAALKPTWRAYGLLGNQPGRGRALVLVSVPADVLKPIQREPLAYGFRMRLVARSGPRSVVLDSVRNLGVKQAPEPGEMITFTTEIPLAVGGWNVGVALEQTADSAGEVLRDSVVPIPDLAARAPVMSDIVLGDLSGGRPWIAPDGSFPLSSTGSYMQGEPIPLFYEIAGAQPRSEMGTEITLVRDDGKDRSVIRFSERIDQPVVRVRRELSTRRSRPGRYILSIRVTVGQRKARRETSLLIVPKPK